MIDNAKRRRSIVGEFIEGLLDTETHRITSLDPVDIVEGTSNGSLSAVQVVKAFSKRAAIGHQLVLVLPSPKAWGGPLTLLTGMQSPNLLEIGFDLALERARELDQYYSEHGKPIGPFHGLPVTLKDQFHIKGLETTFAYVGWIGTFEAQEGTGKERTVDSELIQELYSLGAIAIAKVSVQS